MLLVEVCLLGLLLCKCFTGLLYDGVSLCNQCYKFECVNAVFDRKGQCAHRATQPTKSEVQLQTGILKGIRMQMQTTLLACLLQLVFFQKFLAMA